MRNIKLVVLLFLIIFSSCTEKIDRRYIRAEIFEQGYINCFPEKTYTSKGEKASCELSGVAYYHDSLFFVNDQSIPATTPFMACRFKVHFKGTSTAKIGGLNLLNAKKLEAITITPHQKYMFFTTAFDRFDDKSAKYDAYNTLLYKKINSGEGEKIAYLTKREGVKSSIVLRNMIKKTLKTRLHKNGAEYFKISALAAIPGNILLFGIREIGYDWKNKKNSIMIVGAPYDIVDGVFHFKEDLKMMYHFNPNKSHRRINKSLGLTGMEYDVYNKRLYLITAYETGKNDRGIGGYLWVLPIKNFEENRPPQLAVDENDRILSFAHKPGGVTVLDIDKIMVVHDDDRVTGRTEFKRKLNQAAYTIIDF